MITSSWTGQRALQPLPPKSTSTKRTIGHYNLPESLIQPPPTSSSSSSSSNGKQEYGLPVLKVSKTGKLQTRRLAFTPDHRHLLVTTNRYKHTPSRMLKGFISTIKRTATPNKKNKNIDANISLDVSVNSNSQQHLHSSDAAATLYTTTAELDRYRSTQNIKIIAIATIDRIQKGCHSRRFHLARKEAMLEKDGQAVLELLDQDGDVSCLSIVYYKTSNDSNSHSVGLHSGGLALSNQLNDMSLSSTSSSSCLETLDIVVPHAADFEVLMTVLESLVVLQAEERQRYSTHLLALNAHLVDMNKGWHSDLNMSDFVNVCERMQAPLSRSECISLFQQECAKHSKQQRRSDDVYLSYAAVANLLQVVRARSVPPEANPWERLWTELVATDPVPPVGWQNDSDESTVEVNIQNKTDSISAVAFLQFLRSQQKEYSTSLEEAIELIQILEQMMVPDDLMGKPDHQQQPDRLSKDRFFAFLMADANDLLHPARGRIASDDMTRPLCHYWINTSHDTYLAPIASSIHGKNAYQQKGRAGHVLTDEQTYMAALLRGVRCLEFDVWDSWDGKEPVLSRYAPRTPSDAVTLFESAIRSVRTFLDQQPYTFPVILKIENHCSYLVQVRIATLLQKYLGSADLIVESNAQLDDVDHILPSPESIRGKVLIIGKRPKIIGPGRTIRQDDFDTDIEQLRHSDEAPDVVDEDDDPRVIVGFNELGPIRSDDPDEIAPSALELFAVADSNAAQAAREAHDADVRAKELLIQAEELEKRANGLIQASGMSEAELQRRADMTTSTCSSTPEAVNEMMVNEEKSNKDEGLEIYEILPEFVNASRSNYEEAANRAIEAAGHEAQCHVILRDMEEAYRMAKANLDMSQAQEKLMIENARRAAAEARTHHEHAVSAKARLEKVRELFGNSKDQSSSAGNVVQTALTEAKISEKRAADAEAKSKRAAAAAEHDRIRAETETKKEENLEQEVNDLHHECMKATESAKICRDRVEKASSMLERLNEQIQLIERSSQFRKELQEAQNKLQSPEKGSFTEKHATKLEERDKCQMLINEAMQESSVAQVRRNRLQQAFEEKAYLWKIQAEVAAQTRKSADRSSHVAEELAEDAAEEREAANLRHIARQRAEATVENRGSYLHSFEAQLAEAERAAIDAATIASKSKKRAEHLEKEVEKVKDHSCFIRALEQADHNRKTAQTDFDRAKDEREAKDHDMLEDKRRLEISADVYESAKVNVASETDRKKIEHVYQQEAVIAFNQAVIARQKAERAVQALAVAISRAELERRAADEALRYKHLMEDTTEVPVDLARVTYFHSTKYRGWKNSSRLSGAYLHSLSHNTLLLRVDREPEEERRNVLTFTMTHLFRVFPSWREIHRKPCSNYDSVFAWALGCQLVSTNFHSTDENLLIAEGRFRQNGSCGYALKPSHLTESDSHADHEQKWTFTVLGGYNLPKLDGKSAAVNPMVKVSMYSGSTKEMRISYRTKPAMHNGLNPSWTSHNKFSFTIPTPSISMLAFSIWHFTDDGLEQFLGAAAFPAGSVREGYRSVCLFDGNHARIGTCAAGGLIVKAVRR
ncbi:hypothetical protein MPSEU_000040200 [Mayamaea pseudoterrestris]|nr:hypothetical protein MPSEU_000040200 [Mayamaea pseudoterrestris]